MQPEARRGVAPLLYMHIAVSLCEAAWAVRTLPPSHPNNPLFSWGNTNMRAAAACPWALNQSQTPQVALFNRFGNARFLRKSDLVQSTHWYKSAFPKRYKKSSCGGW